MFNLFKKAEITSYQNVTAAEFKDLMGREKRAVILDVRTPGEVAAGKIKGAKNIDFTSPNFARQIGQLDKTKPYLVYCRSGSRSAQAAQQMAKIGFEKLYNLQGGISAWPYEQTK